MATHREAISRTTSSRRFESCPLGPPRRHLPERFSQRLADAGSGSVVDRAGRLFPASAAARLPAPDPGIDNLYRASPRPSPAMAERLCLPRNQPIGMRRHRGEDQHEDRRHRRHRAHRLEARGQAPRAGHEAVAASPRLGSTASPARDSPEPSRAPRSSSTYRTRPRSTTPRHWSSSRPRPATSWRPKRPREWDITLRCRSWERSACPRAATSGPRSSRKHLVKASPIPYSIVHATQFFEFIERIVEDATDGNTVHLAPVLFQPIAADDVAKAGLGSCRFTGQRHR